MANPCGCNKGCYSKLDVKGMHQLNICWHSTLTASERRYVMSFLYEQATGDVGSDSKTRVHWSLNGSQVCKLAFTAVLGTNRRAIKKLIEGQLDLRSVFPNRAQAGEPQAQKVHEFFLGLYRTAAEPLPHEHYMVRGSVDKISISQRTIGGSRKFRSSMRPTSTRRYGTLTGPWWKTSQLSLAAKSGLLDAFCRTASSRRSIGS